MLIFICAVVLLTSITLGCGYYYIEYTLNNMNVLKREAIIDIQRDKNTEERKYIRPKVYIKTEETVNSNLYFVIYELLANLDWETIKFPDIKENNTAKLILKLLKHRLCETSEIVNDKVDPIINKKYSQNFKTLFDYIFKEFVEYNGNTCKTHKNICSDHGLLITKEYKLRSYEIPFFSNFLEFKNSLIQLKETEYTDARENITEKALCQICKSDEMLIFPRDLFYTIHDKATIKADDFVSMFFVEDQVDKIKFRRAYELVGLLLVYLDENKFIFVIKNDNFYYVRDKECNKYEKHSSLKVFDGVTKEINYVICIYSRKGNVALERFL
ncbi:hypothetical protein CDIK_1780 [Cucumispora dikerogammari]|nr:hypothetical protein CDIK_1780 [Cucumispora dikerogammari]